MQNIKKNYLLLASLLIILAVVPATLFLSQQNQENRSRAAASTQLYLTPSTTTTTPLQKNVGDTISFDVMINPGSNLPSLVTLDLQYDSTKFQPTATPFTVNASAFPSTVEGPVVQNGEVLVSVSIGSDATKAIQSVTKVGTITLKAIAPTDTNPATISFGQKSQVLSLAKSDQATENVLSTTSPAYVTINSVVTPTVTSAITPTSILTPIQPVTPTIFTTLVPTAFVSPTTPASPTLVPSTTLLSFTVFLHGIGNSGDNANPTASSLSNKNPAHPDKNITVYAYDDKNQLAATKSGILPYNATNGNFSGTVDFGNTIPDGYYTILIKEDTHLRKSIPGILHITPLQNNVVPAVTLVAGDINNDNTLNILDYNTLIGCYSDLLPAVNCSDTNKIISDLNDDGAVNQTDYNLFLREITVQNGN